MLEVQKFLETKTLNRLRKEHGINYNICNHKVSLNYSMIEAKDNDAIAKQCRGLVLRAEDPGKTKKISAGKVIGKTIVLARPFDRFFNYGQEACAPVDFFNISTTFSEKLDGTLCIVYFDDYLQEWHVATRSVPEANIEIDTGLFMLDRTLTFRTLFEEAAKNVTGKDFDVWTSNKLFRDTTYIFELTSPFNKILIDYDSPNITLIAARKTLSGKELSPSFVQAQIKVPSPERYSFSSLEDIFDFVSSRNPTKHEGIVACDKNFNRAKIKNIGYLAINKIKQDELNAPRSIMELVLLGMIDDAIPFLAENDKSLLSIAKDYTEKYRLLIENNRNLFKICAKTAGQLNKFNEKDHRKKFAKTAQEHGGWMAPLMSQYMGRTKNLPEWIKSKKTGNGKWTNSFIETIISEIEK